MYDRVIRAYMFSVNEGLRLPYMEKRKEVDGLEIVVSMYKNVKDKNFYCLVAVVDRGEYLFEQGREYSRYYDSDTVSTKDVVQETLDTIRTQISLRKRILTFIKNNKHLPSLLDAAFTDTLILYYTKDSYLRVSKLEKGQIVINLPASEQVYLSDLLEGFGIIVSRTKKEVPWNGLLTP